MSPRLVFIGPSPRSLNGPGYVGRFEGADMDGFYGPVDRQEGWQGAVTGMLLGHPVSLALQEVSERVQGARSDVAGVVRVVLFGEELTSGVLGSRDALKVIDACLVEAGRKMKVQDS